MTDLSSIQQALGASARDAVSSLAQALRGLFGGQADRLLRLHTPLGVDVLMAERAEITEVIGPGMLPGLPDAPASGLAIELLALSPRADLDPVDLLGRPVLLELLTAASRDTLRPFHGHVTAMQLMGADGGLARYRLRIEPWLALLAQRVDSWVFQDMDVLDITEAVFADYQAQGALQPAWRIDVADRSAFARRSLCTQFNETDLAFVQRLWSEEGLFTWFEHTGDPHDPGTLGRHTLVMADHNGALKPNAQARIRYTQPGAVLKEDSLTQWHARRRLGPTRVTMASFDYRSVASHRARADIDAAHGQTEAISYIDQPGAYAFDTPAQADRRARIVMEGLQAQRKWFEGRGTVRTLAPGTTFTLLEHADHDIDLLNAGDDAATFAVLGVVHRVRNNLHADAQAGLQQLLGDVLWSTGVSGHLRQASAQANASDEPIYQARLWAQRLSVPVRLPQFSAEGRLLHGQAMVHGTQTAVVVGLEAPVHTDRDGRIQVQFHWQRGAQSAHRLSHPTSAADADNAPASAASGTWVRVAQSWAGANWGGVFIPRLGQEVVVAFVEGDIDRPVVIGSVYNGQGLADAQGNGTCGGAATVTGNAPAWFPGAQRQDGHEGHAHTAVLSGFKSQSLDASQSGGGGHNQLVFDDTPGQGRVLAQTTQQQTWLQMGHLLQQADNLRLAPRGHGLELHTQAMGAVRAAAGLHVSSHGRTGGTASAQGRPLDTREARHQLQAHAQLLQALGADAQTHRARLPDAPEPSQWPVAQALQASLSSLQAVAGGADDGSGEGENSTRVPIDGGLGAIPISDRPDLVLSAAADIASLTPAHQVLSAGGVTSVTAGQDTQLLAQRHAAWAVRGGISLFTRGESKDPQRAVQDVGMKLHAASGNVNVQAQSGPFSLTALHAVDIQSTAADIVISAPSELVLNGGGGYVKISGGDIEIGTSGAARFDGSMKELGGGGRASFSLPAMSLGPLPQDERLMYTQQFDVSALNENPRSRAYLFGRPYRIVNQAGEIIQQGMITSHTQTVHTKNAEKVTCEIGSGDWEIVGEGYNHQN